jgi:integrase
VSKKKKRKKLWSHVAGRRKTTTEPSSRVRVYERPDVPGLFMACAWDRTASGRPQEVKLPDGITQEAAEALADITAAKRRERILSGRDSLGRKKRITLRQLLEAYHASADAQEWSDKHRGDKERGRDFWLASLDPGMDVEELNKAQVAKVARDAREASSWGVRKERKLLAYLRAATRWGCEQAELYDALPLRGLRLPAYEPDTDGLVYTLEEARRLCGGHPGADWRDVLAINIAYDTGRRISAILALRVEDIVPQEEHGVFLRFRAEFDKGKRHTLAPVSDHTAELLALALERSVVQEEGWLFPEGRLDYDDAVDKPRTKDAAIDGLRVLEELVGVESVERRAFHGLKRTHVTVSMEEAQGDTALVGDITGNLSAELLRKVYRKANRSRSREQVTRVRKRLKVAPDGAEQTREDTRPEGGNDAEA